MSELIIEEVGVAGTMESCDIHIVIEPNISEQIEISLKSIVFDQYGEYIQRIIHECLQDMQVKRAIVTAVDRGALDCTIRARVRAAVGRSLISKEQVDWGKL